MGLFYIIYHQKRYKQHEKRNVFIIYLVNIIYHFKERFQE